MSCRNVGETNPDIAGLGIIISFASQGGVSVVLSFWSMLLWKRINSATPSRHSTASRHDLDPNRRIKQRSIINGILVKVSDLQTMNALGLLIAALVESTSLSLYHMHIIYDTAVFTAVSLCGCLVCIGGSPGEKRAKWTRALPVTIFIIPYLFFSIIFEVGLMDWDDNSPGHCYNTSLITASGHLHPLVDLIYLGITFVYCLCGLILCIAQLMGSFPSQQDSSEITNRQSEIPQQDSSEIKMAIERLWGPLKFLMLRACRALILSDSQVFGGIIHLALAQYPIHLYMVVAMRSSNEGLVGGDSENDWGFGQVVALVLASATVFECFRGVIEYRRFLWRKDTSSPEPSAIPVHLALTPHEMVQVPPSETA